MKKWFVLAALLLVIVPFSADAQDTPQTLSPGIDVTGTLDATNFAVNYVFTGSAGDAITLDAVTASEGLSLVLLLTAPDGAIVARDADITTANEALIADFALPQDGQYVVTMMRGDGASGTSTGTYSLALSGSLTPPSSVAVTEATAAPTTDTSTPPTTEATSVTLTNGGIEITLTWAAAVNFNLEVRDPLGGAIFGGSLPATSGGSIAADINADCTTATAEAPSETISWAQGEVPTGSYEIIIYYVDACTTTGSQQFTLSALVNGETAPEITGTLNPTQQYLAALDIETVDTWTLFNGGVNAGLDVSLLSSQVAAAQPLGGTSVSGTINRETPAIAYTQEFVAGDNVTINMDATSGNLDPFLFLLGPSGNQVASNDDRADTVYSGITQQLLETGIYTIVATRYAQTIGGTEGDFTLTLSLAIAGAATPVTTPVPLATDDGSGTTPVTTPAASSTTTVIRPAGLPEGSVEVILTWNTTADLQLLVRDPAGTSIYDDTPSASSGGILAQGGNAQCNGNVAPASYIYWPTTRLPQGIFEIEVWYQQTCNDINPVTFNLVVNVQGQTIINEQQPTTEDSKFAMTFEVTPQGATAGAGGFFDMESSSTINFFDQLNTATAIEYGDTVPGSITSSTRFILYSFEGQTGDRIRVSMQRTGGTLDTALFLISPQTVQIANNDDVTNPVTGERDTNSLIDSVTLTSTGTYYVLATHYGLQYGGTTGTYNLTLFELPPG
jgi:Bacterial pre-peptidase C-terminal domain